MIENTIPILAVRDLEASQRFYAEVLGFTVDWGGDTFAGLSRDGGRIYLAEGEQGQPGTWVWIGVEDLDAMHAECVAGGAKIRGGITSHPWAREFHVEDPDGHVLRFGGEPDSD